MIIKCVNCGKKFEVNSDLIPQNGRTIQCGSCDHVWFFKDKTKIVETKNDDLEKKIENKIDSFSKVKKATQKNVTIYKNKKSSFSVDKIFSYLIVLTISLIALFIVLETFKHPLYNTFPKFGWYLWNLITLVKDILLFIKDLLY